MASDKRLSASCLLAFMLVATVATAAPSQAEKQAAHKFMDDGVSALKANDWKSALDNFQKAHELMHVPTTAVAIAKAHLAAGHLVEAREAAVEVTRMTKEPGEPKVFEKARREAREIEAQVKGRIPTVRIHVRGPAPTAVAVDGVEIPLVLIVEPVPVNPGKRVITAKAADGAEGRTEIDVREGEKSDADVTLGPPKGAAAPAVDKPVDKPVATAPSKSSTGSPDKPKVLGFGNDDTRGAHSHRSALAEGMIWGGFGIGAVGVGVGTVTGLMTLNMASDVKQSCQNNVCGPEAQNDLDGANTLGAVSTIAFAVGALGLGAGILGLMIPAANRKTGFRFQPTTNGLGGTF